MEAGMSPRKFLLVLGASIGAFFLSACQSSQRAWTPAQEAAAKAVVSTDLAGTMSVSIEGKLWISTLPSAADLAVARLRGVQAVIDLRRPAQLKDDQLATDCATAALTYMHMRPEETEQISDAVVDRVLEKLQGCLGQSVLLVGEDHSSMAGVLAIHRIVHDKVKVSIAIAQAQMCGLESGAPETFVRRQAVRLRNPLASGS
jgi:protein tyrosine phosphatase (PTP) superfamily phosphohydrolase (DUF442 family)